MTYVRTVCNNFLIHLIFVCVVFFLFEKGPGAALFQKEYYELIRSALKPDGVLCSEGKVLQSRIEVSTIISLVVISRLYNTDTPA